MGAFLSRPILSPHTPMYHTSTPPNNPVGYLEKWALLGGDPLLVCFRSSRSTLSPSSSSEMLSQGWQVRRLRGKQLPMGAETQLPTLCGDTSSQDEFPFSISHPHGPQF